MVNRAGFGLSADCAAQVPCPGRKMQDTGTTGHPTYAKASLMPRHKELQE